MKRWQPGTLVEQRRLEEAPYSVRMVVGYKPDGRCMTVYTEPPPWMTDVERTRIYVNTVGELCELAESTLLLVERIP